MIRTDRRARLKKLRKIEKSTCNFAWDVISC